MQHEADSTPEMESEAEAAESSPTPSVVVAESRPVQTTRGISWLTVLLILALVALAVFTILLNQGLLVEQVARWWPGVFTVLALLWLLVSLGRRDAHSLLGSMALLGISLSMLLAAQNIASIAATIVGLTFMAVGVGIILRGLLLRRQPIR